jgi:hypothetical protein
MHKSHRHTLSEPQAEAYWWNFEGRFIPPMGTVLQSYLDSIQAQWGGDYRAPTRGESERRWEWYEGRLRPYEGEWKEDYVGRMERDFDGKREEAEKRWGMYFGDGGAGFGGGVVVL